MNTLLKSESENHCRFVVISTYLSKSIAISSSDDTLHITILRLNTSDEFNDPAILFRFIKTFLNSVWSIKSNNEGYALGKCMEMKPLIFSLTLPLFANAAVTRNSPRAHNSQFTSAGNIWSLFTNNSVCYSPIQTHIKRHATFLVIKLHLYSFSWYRVANSR